MKKLCLGVVVLAASACDATDTGNPVNAGPIGESPTPPEDCLERPRDITPDEVTPLGVTGAQVIALVQGEHRHSLAWGGELDAGHYVQISPESGESEVLLTVEPSGGLRYIERDPRPADPGSEGNPSVCEDVIEVDVGIEVSTAGGALSEQVATRMRAMSADIAYAEVVIGTTLGGSFSAESFYEGFVTAGPLSLRLDFTLTPHGNMGMFSTSQEMVAVSEPERKLTYTQGIAGFSEGGDCPGVVVPLDESVRGASAEAAMALFNASSPGILTTDDSTLTYSVTTLGQSGCLQFSPIAPSEVVIEMPARLSLSAPQANIEGDVAVTLVASSHQGALTNASVRADAESRDPAAFVELVSQFAVTAPIDFSGYVGATFRLEAAASVPPLGSTGTLKVTGFAPCAVPGVACEPRVELFGAHWYDEPLTSGE